MPSKEELLDAIAECSQREASYSNCEKLATFYTLLSYLYSQEDGHSHSISTVNYFPVMNGSEFREAITGKNIDKVVDVLDEHMNVIKLLFPKEYMAVIKKIDEVQD